MENQYDLQYWQDKLARWKEHKEKQDYTQSDESVDKIIEDCETQIEIAKAYHEGRQAMYNELQDAEIKAHDKYIREEFIERIYSKFNQDATLSIVLKNIMNDILKEYNQTVL